MQIGMAALSGGASVEAMWNVRSLRQKRGNVRVPFEEDFRLLWL